MSDFSEYCSQVSKNFERLVVVRDEVAAATALAKEALSRGNKVLFCGNGGSAADAQHLAAELMGRFLFDRRPMPAVALTVDTSALTAIGNDYGYEHVFSRQLRGIAQPGDILVAISTSGNSPNVIRAIEAARDRGVKCVGLTGADGGRMKPLCDICIVVPSDRTNHIQEMHIAIGHAMCQEIEADLCGSARA